MTFIKKLFLKSFLKKLATSNDTRTTLLGLVAAAIIAAHIDYGLLLQGDATQIGEAAGVVVTALWAHFTNKGDKPSDDSD